MTKSLICSTIRWQRDAGGRFASGEPSRTFWDCWKADKFRVKSLGFTLEKTDDGRWRVWMPIEATVSASSEQLTSDVAQPTQGEPANTTAPASATTVLWSDEQEAIFGWFKSGSGNLVVQARAGTGKTTTIKEAFSHAPEDKMLYAVFNKKNQVEAAGKISDARVDVRTLHSLGYAFITSAWGKLGVDNIIEMERIQAVWPEIPDEPARAAERLIGFAKNTFTGVPSVEQLMELAEDRDIFSIEEDCGWSVKRLADVANRALTLALDEESNSGKISFNDMVWLPVACNMVHPKFKLVVVDEAQDMNAPQLEMAIRSVREGGRVCIVGDDRQAIYGFRGAVSDGMGVMRSRLGAGTLGLTTTYRCPKSVVSIASQVVPDYKAAPSAPEGLVTDLSQELLTSTVQIGDAVLSRINAPLMGLCLELLRNGVPARIEGRDIGAQLVNMVKKMKATSVPDFIQKLHKWADKQKRRLAGGKNPEARIAQVEDQALTLSAVAEGAKNVAEIERRILSMFQDSDQKGVRPAVVLSTVHKAKGLEWDRVFVLQATFRKGGAQEEDNVFYVAVTRAKQTLVMVR